MGKDFTTLSVELPSTLHRKNAVFEVECQTDCTHCQTTIWDYNLEHNTGKPRCQTTHRTALSELIVTMSLSDFTATISQSLDFKSCQLQRVTTTMWDRSVRFVCLFLHCQILLPQCGTALSDLTTKMWDSTVRSYYHNTG